ncbi:hypothetical protein GWI33_000390 [Rhynchophorus ferrugineus]|uniref:Uncharacterized protein n=2 Tax=Rhynchophorus ferrugineus TaxID=354439 RepID=A0A834ITD2_RHYFE|nr:hypothetical protein GWI33_000390 [Rhynchophorus ferrugineus]
MKPRYYVHMGVKQAEDISITWKTIHITIFLMILGMSALATKAMFEIMDMYKFNCIIYAKVTFERTFSKHNNETVTEVNCGANPTHADCASKSAILKEYNWNKKINDTNIIMHNNTGFINMRRTVFATIFMCDLMLFAPLASAVISVLLGVLMFIGGRGGAGTPGDMFREIWMCTYPIIGLCSFMIFFCFVSSNLFYNGLEAFCYGYHTLTGITWCSRKMDYFTIQFTEGFKGPPLPFYFNYVLGRVGITLTPILWVIQTCMYILRIVFLVDFSVYLTRIEEKGATKEKKPVKIAKVVTKLMNEKKL